MLALLAALASNGVACGAAPAPGFEVQVGPGDTYPETRHAFAGGVIGIGDVTYATRFGFRPLALDLYLPPPAAHGYVVAAIEYRLRNEARFPAAIQDGNDALRFLRRNAARFGLDPARVGIFGGSAGGHLSALAATSCGVAALEADPGEQPPNAPTLVHVPGHDCVQAAVSWFGVHDFTTVPTPPGQTGPAPFLGCPARSCPQSTLQFASPVTYVDPTDPPMLLIHGTADRLVAMSQSVEFRDRLMAARVPVQGIFLPDVDHGFVGRTDAETAAANAEALRLTLEFFDRNLRHRSP
jgi:acetyl esterase/lipase